MTPHYCPQCDKRFDIPDHYMGKGVTCPGCHKAFTPTEATLSRAPRTEEPPQEPQLQDAHQASEPSSEYQANELANWWSGLTSTMKIAIGVGVVFALVVIIGIPVYNSNQKAAHFENKYDEFVFEADQLANLTNYGVNKGDFTRQLARVEAKWDAIPSGGFKDGAYSDFYDAMSKWREVVRYWDFDSEYLRDQVPLKMTQASTKYQEAKRAMK
jgi:hypothetical protein